MQPLLQTATVHLKRRGNVGALGVMTWVLGTNAGAALGPHLNQIVAGAISDCIGTQILQSVPLLAAMDSGGFGYETIAIQVTTALVGSTLLAIFPGILSKLHPRRLFATADPLMAGIAIE
jgi:hypothetical protein